MWIGGASGLFYRAHDQTTAIRVRGRAGHEPSAQSILGLLIDASQRLWMDTPDGLYALSDFDGEFAAFDSISARFGRAGDAFGGNLLEDAAGRIWTHRFVYDPHAGSMYELSQADGVDIGVGWFRSYDKSADGRLLFGGSKGLLVVDPALFRGWAYAPPLVVTELKRGGVAAPYDGTSTIVVEPDQRSFSIEFAALDYTVPERNRYRYRLHGYDDDWITTDAGNRVASYGNLWPGDYSLEVHGSNRNGDFSPHQLNIRVTVLPLFWQTPWFFALAVLALGLMVYAGFRWRTRVLRARATVLRALVEQRTLELRSSHEHLAASKGDLESAHSQLTATHERLLDTQQQMVLQEKMAALGTLTAGVAHEINNPTNFADGAVQQIEIGLDQLHEFLRHLAGEEAPAEVLQAIAERFTHLGEMTATAREGHERIKRIVRDLRQFTRLDEAELKAVPIAEPIQSTVNLVRTRFDRIRFDLDLKFNPTIECQPAKLGQVFMNLFVNACEAIGECKDGRAGVVRIGTHADGGQVAIDIADNGMGMDDATLQHVFEPFFTTKPVGAGTGLGLSIVFGIVKDHGGSIEVSSKVGEGTRFRVTLPLARQSLPPPKG
jgi:signal transduction histidine kinase